MMKYVMKNNKGITLIALVITIIVLLILSAVAIATLTGENGILTRAQNAVNEYNKGAGQEQIDLSTIEQWMNYYANGTPIDFSQIINLKGVYEIKFLENGTQLDCIREYNGELYRETINIMNDINVLNSSKISELDDMAIPLYCIFLEMNGMEIDNEYIDNLQFAGQIDDNNFRMLYNSNFYIITNAIDEGVETFKISKDTIQVVEPEDIDDWTYRIEDDNTVTITGYRGDNSEIVIPNVFNSMFVKRVEATEQKKNNNNTPGMGSWRDGYAYSFLDIDKCEFYGYHWRDTSITKITISEGIEELGEGIFVGMCAITEIKIPDSVKRIENYAFSFMHPTNCIINIPSNVSFVGCFWKGGTQYIPENLVFNIEAEEIPETWDEEWQDLSSSLFEKVTINLGVK